MSSMSVPRNVLRLYRYLKPHGVKELSQALSKIHISFDGWTTKGDKRSSLGFVMHYFNSCGNLQVLPIVLPQLRGAHSGERMAETILKTLDMFSIDTCMVGYFVLGNASDNDLVVLAIAQKIEFSATDCCLCCGPHTLTELSTIKPSCYQAKCDPCSLAA
jgi:hypothetical protein